MSGSAIAFGFYWTVFIWFRMPPNPLPILDAFGWTTLMFAIFIGMIRLPFEWLWTILLIFLFFYVPTMY